VLEDELGSPAQAKRDHHHHRQQDRQQRGHRPAEIVDIGAEDRVDQMRKTAPARS
jgi:hypothetical protein